MADMPDIAFTQITEDEYARYSIERKHCRHEGLLALPVYGPAGTSCRVGRLHAPFETLRIDWMVEGKFGKPICPDPALFDTNNRFLYGERCGNSPKFVESLVGYAWRLFGVYHYAVLVPVGLNTDFPLGKLPFDPLDISGTTIPAERWKTGFLDEDPFNHPLGP